MKTDIVTRIGITAMAVGLALALAGWATGSAALLFACAVAIGTSLLCLIVCIWAEP